MQQVSRNRNTAGRLINKCLKYQWTSFCATFEGFGKLILHLVHQKPFLNPFLSLWKQDISLSFFNFQFLTNKPSSAFKWASLHLVCFILSFGFLTICCRAASNRLCNKQNIVSLNIVLWCTYTHLYSCIISYWSRHDGTLQSVFLWSGAFPYQL